MINVIPVMGPNGAISAATTGLLQQNVLKFDQPDIHNLLAQTLLVPERDGSGGSGIGYDLGALIDRVEKLEVNYSSIKTDVDNLWVWVNNFHTKLGGEFDPDYIKERSINGDMKYYSYRSDVISYNSTDTPSNNNGYVNVAWILDQIRGGSGIDPWPYGPTDDRKYGPNAKFDPDRFDDMAHGGRSSWNSFVSQNDGYLHPVFGLHSGINAGFISLVSYNNLTALTKYWGGTYDDISANVNTEFINRVNPAVLKQAGVKYRDLRYLDYGDTIDDSNFNDDPYDRLHSYKTIVDAIKNLEDISGQGDYVDLDRFFVKWDNGGEESHYVEYFDQSYTAQSRKIYVKKMRDGRWWSINNADVRISPYGVEIPAWSTGATSGKVYVNGDVVLYDNAYLLNIDYTPNLFDTPSRNDYVNLYNLYSSSEKSIFFKDFNAKSYGYVDASGNLNVSSGCYLWVGDGNGSYVLINESSVDFTPSMDASSGMAVRWVLKNGITPIVESGGAQKVYNPSEFYSTMNYYRPGSSLSKPNPLSEVAILDDIKNVKLSTFHWRGHIYNGPAGSVKGIIYQPDEFWQVAALADDAPPTLNWSPINSIYQYDGATWNAVDPANPPYVLNEDTLGMWSNLNQSVKSDGSLDITKNPPSWYFIGGVWNRLDFIYDDAWVIKYPALNGQPDAGSIGQVLTSSGNINNNPTWSTIKQSIGTSISTYTDVTTGTENKIGLKYNFGANVTPDSSSELNLVPCYKSSYEAWKTGDKLNNHTLYFVVPDITTS